MIWKESKARYGASKIQKRLEWKEKVSIKRVQRYIR